VDLGDGLLSADNNSTTLPLSVDNNSTTLPPAQMLSFCRRRAPKAGAH